MEEEEEEEEGESPLRRMSATGYGYGCRCGAAECENCEACRQRVAVDVVVYAPGRVGYGLELVGCDVVEGACCQMRRAAK